MKDLHHPPTSSKLEDTGAKFKTCSPSNRNVDAATIKKKSKDRHPTVIGLPPSR